ncbi:hypothetical protein GW626_10010 [Peribacillus muralis]|uniref:hypothetical protein n=1 Tax=Peribacillus muralis TaxID=264697 RepID=UPI001F4EE84D|nr:hypothetical protein [Peribacillus muralis]MCK1993600.1 hypothetical protein [Peribacillus muralis]MCK2014112.1 hypothetical protein [Peribacillus muralis]
MKKLNLLKYAVLVLSLFLSYQAVEAHDKNFQVDGTYISTKRDVTGDQKMDIIQVQGLPYKAGSKFLKKIELSVESNRRTISVPLDAGYNPDLKVADLNNDGLQDVLVTVLMEGNKRLVTSYAYTFKDGEAHELDIPPTVPVTAQFLDGYKAQISIEGQKPVVVDIRSRKKAYDELGIYQNGKLNEPTELLVNPYSTLDIKSVFGKGKRLIGIQKVSGADERDPLVEIQSVWTYKNEWKLVKAKVKEIKVNKQKKG